MNIFYVSEYPDVAAKFLCDKHVVKMIVETAQLLSTAHRLLDDYDGPYAYRATHKNHPSAVWVRSSVGSYFWTQIHLWHLLREYTFRYEKVHATERLMPFLNNPPNNTPSNVPWIDPPQCMPDKYKRENTVEAYRAYYIGEKSRFARWTKRPPPEWYTSAFT